VPISSRSLPLGSRIPWFSLTDLEGRPWTTALVAEGRPVVIAFLCQHSPYVCHIEHHLAGVAARYMSAGISFVGIASNDVRAYPSDCEEMLRGQAERAGFTFPYCLDPNQQAARAFGAACTPEFFVYDEEGRLEYHGEYDASRPWNEIPVTGEALEAAVTAVMSKHVKLGDQRPSFGCSIKWTAGMEPGYAFS
jgi:peroxiredoxin